MRIKPGEVRAGVDIFQTHTFHLADGLVATDGIQHSAIATVGTTAVEILNKLIDPGVSMNLKEIQSHFIYKFTELKDAVGSLIFHLKAREEYVNSEGTIVTSNYCALSATYALGVGSLATVEGTLGGYLNVGSIGHAPVRIVFTAQAKVADSMACSVKNASYLKLVGIVVPGA